jgi:hypothetical protein
LVLAIGALIAVSLFCGLMAAVTLHTTTRSAEQITHRVVDDLEAIHRVRLTAEQLVASGRGYMLTGGAADLQQLTDIDADLDRSLEALRTRGRMGLWPKIVMVEHAAKAYADIITDANAAHRRVYREALRQFTEMHPLQVWYARVTSKDFIQAAPKGHRLRLRDRIDKALARAGSEMDFPKLAQVVGGRAGIRDTPPLIYHPAVTCTPTFWPEIGKVFASYRETLSDDRRILLDQYQIIDAAIKVVGIGSVGRRCWIALLMSATNQPLFLQFKETVASVLEPYAGKSAYAHHGQRVVIGQRLVQPASDVFLGWVTAQTPEGRRQFYVRQLRDAKIKPVLETFDAEFLSAYGEACGWVLARAHARTGDQCAISGYLGKGAAFDEAMGNFALAYADQTERDYASLKAAVRNGKVKVYQE